MRIAGPAHAISLAFLLATGVVPASRIHGPRLECGRYGGPSWILFTPPHAEGSRPLRQLIRYRCSDLLLSSPLPSTPEFIG